MEPLMNLFSAFLTFGGNLNFLDFWWRKLYNFEHSWKFQPQLFFSWSFLAVVTVFVTTKKVRVQPKKFFLRNYSPIETRAVLLDYVLSLQLPMGVCWYRGWNQSLNYWQLGSNSHQLLFVWISLIFFEVITSRESFEWRSNKPKLWKMEQSRGALNLILV